MKVIHLIGGGDTGGAKTHVLNLLRELNQFIDARLVCFRKGEFSEDAEKLGIPIDVIDTGNPIRGLQELKQLIGDQKIDIIHCHGARGNLMGNLIKKYVKAPVITTVHSDYRLDYLGRPVARLSYGTTNMVALRRVNFYIGVADPMTDILIERGFPADRIYTVYNGIDFKTPIETVPREEFFQSIGFPVEKDDVVAGIAARLSPVKDIPTLLKAMKIACEKSSHLKLVIAGDGEDREKLKELAKSLGLNDRVYFAGWVSDTNSFYHSLDINLLTSVSEGFPYVIPEGARMHLPTISSRVGGIPVLIDDGKNGLLFEPGDVNALAEHLIRLAEDPQLRKTLGDALYEKASQMCSIDFMIQSHLKIYDDVLKRSARAQEKKLSKQRDGAVICGAYGHGNAGDDAILKSIIQSVKKLDPYIPITVLAKNTESIKKRYRVNAVYTFNIFKIFRAMKKSQLYINGGGTLIQNATSHRSLWYYLFTLRLAKMLGNKVDMYGCGIGPVSGKRNTKLVKKVLDRSVDTITLREKVSMEKLHEMGVTHPKIRLSCDPALMLSPASKEDALLYLEKHQLSTDGKYICFMLRSWQGFADHAKDLAACADFAYEKLGLHPVFLSLNIFHDTYAAKEVAAHMNAPFTILDDPTEPELLISVLSYMDMVVSMRLHGLIFSSVSGVPLVGVSYDPKIGSFLQYLGYGECLDLKEATENHLIEAVKSAYTQKDQRKELQQHAKKLMEVEQENIKEVKDLLGL
jgi:polysaccharide pyruvyl transferase CsaB